MSKYITEGWEDDKGNIVVTDNPYFDVWKRKRVEIEINPYQQQQVSKGHYMFEIKPTSLRLVPTTTSRGEGE